MKCFYCCKYLIGEGGRREGDAEDDEENSLLKSATIKQNVIKISKYLYIPGNVTASAKRKAGALSRAKICEDCRTISEKLGDLCDQLEITKLKINYYLNQLSSQIIQQNGYNQNQPECQQMSRFQRFFHKKWKLKIPN